MAESARAVALRCLQRIEDEGAYANLAVPAALDATGLETRDRAFVTELVYGTTRMRRACDALVDRFVVSEPDAPTRRVLRLGAYQLAFAGVAAHAAVGEERERLWAMWRDVDEGLDGYAARRPDETAVVVLEPVA